MPHRLLCVHPHPDDESIACGGLIARAVREGHDVHVVTCTGGEEGENQSGIDLAGRDMGDVRRGEMADAIEALGHDGRAPTHHWLGFRDSGMAGEPSNEHPEAFHGADLDEAAGRLARLVRQVRPDVLVSDDERGTYGHPDHVKANRVAVRAVALAADPTWESGSGPPWRVPKRYVSVLSRRRIFAFQQVLAEAGLPTPFGDGIEAPEDLEFGVDDDEVTTVVDVADVLDAKRAAMAAHRSQIGPDSFFLNTPPGVVEDLFAVEEFALRQGSTGADGDAGRERDVFAGLSQ